MEKGQSFAAALRAWRQRRGRSQLDLAGRADISQRHLSFLELGRAAPSRDMVLRLATALEVPLRQHNALLLAAGFAPVWRETDLAAPERPGVALGRRPRVVAGGVARPVRGAVGDVGGGP